MELEYHSESEDGHGAIREPTGSGARFWPSARAFEVGRKREAISLTPRLQPGDQEIGIDKEPFLTVFVGRRITRNR